MTDVAGTFSVEARPSRHIVGRVARGEALRDALLRVADEHGLTTAWVSAIGAFEWIELAEYDQVEQRDAPPQRFERCELVSMHGNLSVHDGTPSWRLHATVSTREDGRGVTCGGHVADGVVFALEFRIDCFDDLQLRRADDEATGLQLWTADVPASAREADADEPLPSTSETAVTWAMAAQVSAHAEPVVAEEQPERGDYIDHERFGLCKIEGLTGDGVCMIKLPNARRKKIKLDAMLVLPPRHDGDRRVFPVRPRRKG